MENNPKKQCNHIISYSKGIDESWLDYSDEEITKYYVEVEFKYCPLCGEEIRNDGKSPLIRS